MATDQQNPISASAAAWEPRWPEGNRGRQRPAPESFSPAALEAIGVSPRRQSTVTRAARYTCGLAGYAVHFLRGVRTRGVNKGDALDQVRGFVLRYPNALLGAGIAGFLAGRKLKRL